MRTQTQLRFLEVLLVGTLALGCATGKEPPAKTKMIKFEGTGGKVTFTFGSEKMCCYGGLNGCTNGETPESKTVCDLDRPRPIYPSMQMSIPSFELDEHEVTNLQYQHCVAHGSCTKPQAVNAEGGGKYDKYYDEDNDEFANHPVIRVTWTQAEDYCRFAGKRLPTEFEWEAAVQSATTPQTFIWGDSPAGCDGEKVAIAQCNADYGFPQPVKGAMTTDELSTPGGTLYGMAGNVSEWTSTLHDPAVTCVDKINEFKDNSSGTEKDCLSSFEECADQSSAGDFKNCAAQMRECTDCLARQDAMAMTNPECFGMCTEVTNPDSDGNGTALRQNTHWVCRKQKAGEVLDGAPKTGTGAARSIRGANYLTTDLCEARPRWRHDQKKDQTSALPTLGFRCARSL